MREKEVRLSRGRLILGVGIGSDIGHEYSCFVEATDDGQHGVMLDEGLEVLTKLWSGEPFHFEGNYYRVHEVCFLPTPVQSPRIPIWVADVWPHTRPLRRAARFDGVVPMAEEHTLSPEELAHVVATVQKYRASVAPFDVAFGSPDLAEQQVRELLPAYAEAGVTWWLECFSWSHTLPEVRARIRQGPPLL